MMVVMGPVDIPLLKWGSFAPVIATGDTILIVVLTTIIARIATTTMLVGFITLAPHVAIPMRSIQVGIAPAVPFLVHHG